MRLDISKDRIVVPVEEIDLLLARLKGYHSFSKSEDGRLVALEKGETRWREEVYVPDLWDKNNPMTRRTLEVFLQDVSGKPVEIKDVTNG